MNNTITTTNFVSLKRNIFREYFQPSRIVLALLPANNESGVNIITICFTMHCSYKPPMIAFSIQKGSYSYELLDTAKECVLAVPGGDLSNNVLKCGIESGRNYDKMIKYGFTPLPSDNVSIPGISECIANIETKIIDDIFMGDHRTVFLEVLEYKVNKSNNNKCLLSIGPNTNGYKILSHKGIHRLGTIK